MHGFRRRGITEQTPGSTSLDLFDVNGGGTYSIVVTNTSDQPQPPNLEYIGDKVVSTGDPLGLGFLVQASDPNGTIPILTTTNLPSGAEFQVTTNGLIAVGTFFWRPQAGQSGIYHVTFTASDGQFTDEETITIYVNDSALQFRSAAYTVSEAGGSVRVTVNRSGTAAYGAASVHYATFDGTATAGLDYTVVSGTLNWTNGDAADKFFDVPIISDSIYEGDEQFTVNLSETNGAGMGSPNIYNRDDY